MTYEMTVGLETHIELSTDAKIFCGCSTAFGGEPNTRCCPVCLGLPGALPTLNRQVVHHAVLAGLATHCRVNAVSRMDRKNYVYPDLPKAYQITQWDQPLCEDGYLELDSGRRIGIRRIHIEEDAGKLIRRDGQLYIDYNRAGVPLIEIVTAPDFRTTDEIREYLEKLQRLMRHIGVSDCKMQEGSLRCDVNLSVRPVGCTTLGVRTELKNMNSFSMIAKAVTFERDRQIVLLQAGDAVVQETRRYDEATGRTESMRGKEDTDDYRYFPEPDIPPIYLDEAELDRWRDELPELPDDRRKRFVEQYGLSTGDAEKLLKYRRIADFFEAACVGVSPKTVAHFVVGPLFAALSTDAAKEAGEMPVTAEHLRELVEWIDHRHLRMELAKRTLERMIETGLPVGELLSEDDLAVPDAAALEVVCRRVIDGNAKAVADYLGGKETAIKALIGGVMRETRGAADAAAAELLLKRMIKEGNL